MSQAPTSEQDTRAYFATIGREAYERDESAAPALNATVMDALKGLVVGDPHGLAVMEGFTSGFSAAADEAANAVLAGL